jgi:hypothetical protein
MSWTKHLNKEHHSTDSTRERSLAEREGTSLAEYHANLHDEYDENKSMTHTHDKFGQLIFNDRRKK